MTPSATRQEIIRKATYWALSIGTNPSLNWSCILVPTIVYTPAKFHVCISNGCNTIVLTKMLLTDEPTFCDRTAVCVTSWCIKKRVIKHTKTSDVYAAANIGLYMPSIGISSWGSRATLYFLGRPLLGAQIRSTTIDNTSMPACFRSDSNQLIR